MYLSNISSEDIGELDKTKIEQYGEQLLDWVADKVFDIVLALFFLVIGFKVCKFIVKIIKKSFAKTGMEDSVEGFLVSVQEIKLGKIKLKVVYDCGNGTTSIIADKVFDRLNIEKIPLFN